MIIAQNGGVAGPAFQANNGPAKFFPCAVDVIVDNRISSVHWHNFTQVWYTVSGEYYHTINGVRKKQTAGSAALVFPFAVHSIDSSASNLSDTRVISVNIYRDLFSTNEAPFIPLTFNLASFDNLLLHPFVQLSGKDKELSDELMESAASEYALKFAMRPQKIVRNMIAFLDICARNINVLINTGKLAKAREQTTVITAAADILHNSCSADYSLDAMSNHFFMSKRSFSDKFKETSGRTFGSYSKQVRLNKAIQLLRYTEMSLSEISDNCGYSGSSHFINECKEEYGLPPRALKMQMVNYDRTYGEYLHSLDCKKNEWLGMWSEADKYEYRMFALGYI